MAYLLDANVFIEAKRRYYGMDFCPGFWEWLRAENKVGKIFSIEKIWDELKIGGDELSTWADEAGESFFLPPDEKMLTALAATSEWVQAQHYRPEAVRAFLEDPDYYLTSYALAHNHIVITHEVPSDGVRQVKIPNVCIGLKVKHKTPFEMLRLEKARFVLDGKRGGG